MSSKPHPVSRGLLVALAFLAASTSLPAWESGQATPTQLVQHVAASPTLRAASARVEAMASRVKASGLFPDPELEAMVSGTNSMGETMPMWELSLRQPLPRLGERASEKELRRAQLAMAQAERVVMASEMSAELAASLAQAWFAEQAILLRRQHYQRLEKALALVDAKLSVGKARLGDRLAVQARMTETELMLEEDQRMLSESTTELRTLLGLGAEAAIPAWQHPLPDTISPELSPQALLASARQNEARAMERMAGAVARPMSAVGLRFAHEQERGGNNDTIGLAVMTELPWNSRRRSREEAQAARFEREAARAEVEVAGQRTLAALARVQRADKLLSGTRRLSAETGRRLAAELESNLADFGTGAMTGDQAVLMLVDLLERLSENELTLLQAERGARLALAELWRHAPPSSFPLTSFPPSS